MGCKFSKTNKVLPVVESTHAKPVTSSFTNPETKEGLDNVKKTPPVTREVPSDDNNVASSATNDAESPATNDAASPAFDPYENYYSIIISYYYNRKNSGLT